MPDILLGHDSNPGGRKYNEDRCASDIFTSAGGLKLSVAVVCDGVGGEERGERAAQLAVDTVLLALRDSTITDPAELISTAVRTANQTVYTEATRLGAGERMACTMALAVVVNDQTLFVANVGDSRVYLYRDGKAMQLTRDHTFEHVMVWTGKLSPEAAASNPDANRVMRVLGPKPNLQVDLGLYINTTDYGEANKTGKNGIAIKPGDSVLVCSDGLIKLTLTTKQELVTEKEIARIFSASEGQAAARAIMSIALGRIPVGEAVDNISIALLQPPDPSRAVNQAQIKRAQQEKIQQEQRRKVRQTALTIGIPAAIILLVVVVGGGYFVTQLLGQQNATATQLALATYYQGATETIVAGFTATPTPTFTPTPTSTPTPTPLITLVPNQVAQKYQGDTFIGPTLRDELISVPTADRYRFAVSHDPKKIDPPSNLYVFGGSQFLFDTVDDGEYALIVSAGTDFFVNTVPYPGGVEIKFEGTTLVLRVQGCGAVQYTPQEPTSLLFSCYKGDCQYRVSLADGYKTLLPQQRLRITELADLQSIATEGEEIKAVDDDNRRYRSLLDLTVAGRTDSKTCEVPLLPPTRIPVTPTAPALATPTSGAVQPPPPTNPPSLPPTDPPPPTEPPNT